MLIVDCHNYRRRPPAGSVYIGREHGRLARSPLANPFAPESRGKTSDNAIVLPDDRVLERYARHMVRNVAQGFREVEALRELGRESVLACWCVERTAGLVGAGRPAASTPCHGDVVWTVWAALHRLGWRLATRTRRGDTVVWDARAGVYADPCEDLDAANAVIGALYKEAFGEPLVWGRRSEAA